MDGLWTMSGNRLRELLLVCLLLPAVAAAQEDPVRLDGHVKARLLGSRYPDDSAFASLTGSSASSLESELRLNAAHSRGAWSFDAAWQLYAGYGDRIALQRDAAASSPLLAPFPPTDDRRLMDLSATLADDGKKVALHRLDRLSIRYASDKTVVRIGRQAITWGNGLVFSPMDIVNPFDPVAVDTEYKAGDDMLYVQYLFDSGNDLQAVQVFRREPATGEPSSGAATSAVKYHGISGDAGYDLFVARHYGEAVVAVGGDKSMGGAIVRGDAVWADTVSGGELQLVANVSYSWVFGGRNMSGLLEYYFSGFGQPAGRYDVTSLADNTALLQRLQRGESFTLGRHYLAGGVTVELSPLWLVTPNLFANLDDGSALLQLVSRNSLGDNAEFLGALNLPLGPNGSEFGGVETATPGLYRSSDFSVFAQFAWYF